MNIRPMSTEVITAAQATEAELRQHAENVNEAINLIVSHEEAFREATLEPCLIIGREIAKAQAIFGLNNNEKMAVARDGKALLSRGVTTESPRPNPLGFTAWLNREIPRLKGSTAYKYMTCFKALELPTDATDIKIRAAVKQLRHEAGRDGKPMPSLNSLYKANKPPRTAPPNLPAPGTETGKSEAQVRLEDARENWYCWREEGAKFVNLGYLDDLDRKGLEEMKEFQGWLRDRINARLKTL